MKASCCSSWFIPSSSAMKSGTSIEMLLHSMLMESSDIICRLCTSCACGESHNSISAIVVFCSMYTSSIVSLYRGIWIFR